MDYKDRLKTSREAAGLTQDAVAARLTAAKWPTTAQAVGHWESGVRLPRPRTKALALHALLGLRAQERREAEAEWLVALDAPRDQYPAKDAPSDTPDPETPDTAAVA